MRRRGILLGAAASMLLQLLISFQARDAIQISAATAFSWSICDSSCLSRAGGRMESTYFVPFPLRSHFVIQATSVPAALRNRICCIHYRS